MNKKGFYTGAIALIAITLIMALAFNAVSTVQAHQYKSQVRAIFDVKWSFQNAHYLLGRSSADALADATHASGTCTVDASLVSSYLSQTLNSVDLNCGIEGVPTVTLNPVAPLPGIQADADISISLWCGEGFSNSFVRYEKALTFKKTVTPFVGLDCYVDVLDRDSAECEVDTIVPSPPGCGS